ncbi:MAG: hypothetical protein HGA31_00940 [Candidatus Moranbacteria bacterium]|nr:hypothetical protein [Candidatus Moranbacteria bacterium]
MKIRTIMRFWKKFVDRSVPAMPFVYASLVEIIELFLFSFALIITAEAVLPGIFSQRLNLAKPFLAILILIAIAGFIGKKTGVSFPFLPDKKSVFTWIGIAWLAFLLTLSSIKFPPFIVPIIVGALFLTVRLFWRILFRKE